MKLNNNAKELLIKAFEEQHKEGRFPMPRSLGSIKRCHGKAHKKPTLVFGTDGSFAFQCEDCLKDIIPSGWKTQK